MGISNREHGHGEPEVKRILMVDGAAVGEPPKSEEELEDFLHMWVPARPGAKLADVDYGVEFLQKVANISYVEALAALYARNPLVYDSLAFSTWGNGYGKTAGEYKVDLLDALKKAALNKGTTVTVPEKIKREYKDNRPSPKRVQVVGKVIRGLMKMVDDNKLKEVESAQPENLTQHELTDTDGNKITFINTGYGSAAHIEIRNAKGQVIAQSWDGDGWSVDRYIENGIDFQI